MRHSASAWASPAAAAAAAALLLASAAPALAQGCAMCKKNLEENGGAGLIEGFYWSILLLISLPILMTGGFALLFWRAAKRKREREEESPVPEQAT